MFVPLSRREDFEYVFVNEFMYIHSVKYFAHVRWWLFFVEACVMVLFMFCSTVSVVVFVAVLSDSGNIVLNDRFVL